MADAWLYGTAPAAQGGAQIAFQNVGGTRASFRVNATPNGEQPGQITYAEAYAVVPFSNVMVTVDLTGDQIRQGLEQQYIATRGRPALALGVSAGFSYAWDALAPQGTNRLGGGEDLAMLVAYLQAHPGLTAPASRIDGL